MNNLCENILFGKAGSLQTRIDGSITPDFVYLLVTAFLEADNKDLALMYYNELEASSGSDTFVQLVQKEFD